MTKKIFSWQTTLLELSWRKKSDLKENMKTLFNKDPRLYHWTFDECGSLILLKTGVDNKTKNSLDDEILISKVKIIPQRDTQQKKTRFFDKVIRKLFKTSVGFFF